MHLLKQSVAQTNLPQVLSDKISPLDRSIKGSSLPRARMTPSADFCRNSKRILRRNMFRMGSHHGSWMIMVDHDGISWYDVSWNCMKVYESCIMSDNFVWCCMMLYAIICLLLGLGVIPSILSCIKQPSKVYLDLLLLSLYIPILLGRNRCRITLFGL